MTVQNPSDYCKPVQTIAAVKGSADKTGDTVDCQGFEFAQVLYNIGNIGAVTTAEFTLEESDDDSTWTEVPTAVLNGGVALDQDTDRQVYVGQVRLASRKRYLRVNVDHTGVNDMAVGVVINLVGPVQSQHDQDTTYAYAI